MTKMAELYHAAKRRQLLRKEYKTFLPGRVETLMFFYNTEDTAEFVESQAQIDYNIDVNDFAALDWEDLPK